ncbi:MAG: Hint domain-containing protein [Mariprofundaceae bacterium]|nr:Hint domain-containing protein [Mariprofundaceae bacterium]
MMMKLISIALIILCSQITTTPLANASIAMSASEISRIDKEPVSYKTWNQASFLILKADGSDLFIEILRPKWWFQKHQVEKGKSIHLSLPEMGVSELAKVIDVKSLPDSFSEVPNGGEIVTGKFTHKNASVIDLFLENTPEKPLGVTSNHPIWSIDRNGWVNAGDLRVGETLKTINGVTKLIRRVEREGKHTVYNLEIHRRHTFYVADAGVLVHNTCIGKSAKKLTTNQIGDFLGAGPNWHKGQAKKKFLKQFKQQMKGDTNADFHIDKRTGEILLQTNKSKIWIRTGLYF